MRKVININKDWSFIEKDSSFDKAIETEGAKIDVPFTWNNIDGQDGGNDYVRAAYVFVKRFPRPEHLEDEVVYIEFKGVNSTADVILNGEEIAHHDGGYSTFRAEITPYLKDENILYVREIGRAHV